MLWPVSRAMGFSSMTNCSAPRSVLDLSLEPPHAPAMIAITAAENAFMSPPPTYLQTSRRHALHATLELQLQTLTASPRSPAHSATATAVPADSPSCQGTSVNA